MMREEKSRRRIAPAAAFSRMSHQFLCFVPASDSPDRPDASPNRYDPTYTFSQPSPMPDSSSHLPPLYLPYFRLALTSDVLHS